MCLPSVGEHPGSACLEPFFPFDRDEPTSTYYQVGIQPASLEVSRAVAKWLEYMNGSRSLEFSDTSFTETSLQALVLAIAIKGDIEELSFTSCSLGNEGAELLALLLEKQNYPATLLLRKNDIGDIGVAALFDAIRKGTGRVQHIDLSNNAISPEGMRAIAACLRSPSSLTRLTLSGCGIDVSSCQILANALSINDILKRLDLSFNQIGLHGCSYLLSAVSLNESSVLQVLDLRNNGITLNRPLPPLPPPLGKSSLHTLDLSGNPLGDHLSALLALFLHDSNIKRLGLVNTGIQNSGAFSLVRAFGGSTTLKTLDLSHNQISDEATRKDIGLPLLLQTCPLLHVLNLSHNQITGDGAFGLLETLEELSSRQAVTRFRGETDHGDASPPRSIPRALSQPTSPCVYLMHNSIGRERVEILRAQSLTLSGFGSHSPKVLSRSLSVGSFRV